MRMPVQLALTTVSSPIAFSRADVAARTSGQFMRSEKEKAAHRGPFNWREKTYCPFGILTLIHHSFTLRCNVRRKLPTQQSRSRLRTSASSLRRGGYQTNYAPVLVRPVFR